MCIAMWAANVFIIYTNLSYHELFAIDNFEIRRKKKSHKIFQFVLRNCCFFYLFTQRKNMVKFMIHSRFDIYTSENRVISLDFNPIYQKSRSIYQIISILCSYNFSIRSIYNFINK